MTHIHVNDVRDAIEALVPDVLDDHIARQNPVFVLHKIFKQSIFLSGKVDSLARSPYLLGQAIEFQVPDAEGAGAIHWASTQQRFDSHEQFRKSKRLRQVVVCAQLKELYLVIDRVAGSQHENGKKGIVPSNTLNYFGAGKA